MSSIAIYKRKNLSQTVLVVVVIVVGPPGERDFYTSVGEKEKRWWMIRKNDKKDEKGEREQA